MLRYAFSVQVPFMGAPAVLGQPGIRCVGLYWPEQLRGLVLIADERERNLGASATNAMSAVLAQVARQAPEGFGLAHCAVVEIDSMGSFDLVQVQWGQGGQVESWEFAPLLHAPEPARSLAAFQARFGVAADAALTELRVQGFALEASKD
jgi:hypothetical protein